MVTGILRKVFGSRNDRLLKTFGKTVLEINGHEGALVGLSDTQLQAKTPEFKQRLAQGETLDELLPEAFAVVREGSRRALGMRHFDVQLIGGMVLHHGKIAEMRTGEGKTLTATLPVYLNALMGDGVHVVTVNEYLAARDAQWMGRLYQFLGMSVGVNLGQTSSEQKRAAYACDITYGTNNEFGFDYLRDNMVYEMRDKVQRAQSYAIVDEVDSILIDEARTPLIISGQAEDHTELYLRLNGVPALLTRMTQEAKSGEPEPAGDFWIDEKQRTVLLSEAGHEKAENILSQMGLLSAGASLYDPANILLMHHLMAALRGQYLFHRDQHYVVQDNEIVIVDEFTGRLMTGRRWSDGLHQAVEAKEGVKIQNENQTLASITFQNYFRLYKTLAGMTGTADTEAYEFQEIYGLETVVIPSNRSNARIDKLDQVYKSAEEKYRAIIMGIAERYSHGQPVLVGTTSIENSELLSSMLHKEKLPHQVLNAKQHAREAEIVAQAGRPAMITIATNMAGRGTDIVLGGNVEKQVDLVEAMPDVSPEDKVMRVAQLKNEWQALHDAVISAGGLHIIGTERHESRRVDNQLRGRSGRQGDPGSSRFYLSLDDPLLRIFAGDRVRAIMERLKMPEGEPIEAGLVMRSIESAQRKVEARNFDIRKQLLEYDDVSNDQRKVIYQQRNELLASSDVSETINALRLSVMTDVVRESVPEGSLEEQWDLASLERTLVAEWHVNPGFGEMSEKNDSLTDEDVLERVLARADAAYEAKLALAGRDQLGRFARSVMLSSIDSHWREHLAALDHLRQGIHLRSFAQKNPKQEYKREAFELFGLLLNAVGTEVTRALMTVNVQPPDENDGKDMDPPAPPLAPPPVSSMQFQHPSIEPGAAMSNEDSADIALGAMGVAATTAAAEPFTRFGDKVGRNDPCPCGSGKKYKQCHGRLE